MKHLLIAAMIAILIGTIQAVKIKSQAAFWKTTCEFTGARLAWRRGFFEKDATEDVKPYIDRFRAEGRREIRNDVATFGWDRAYQKPKTLRMDWKCCDWAGCRQSTASYRENSMVPLYR